ncbi:MAG: hypothetical protein ACTSX6_10570 [Candidatus Heimdallarchaeaceae archaeon]
MIDVEKLRRILNSLFKAVEVYSQKQFLKYASKWLDETGRLTQIGLSANPNYYLFYYERGYVFKVPKAAFRKEMNRNKKNNGN